MKAIAYPIEAGKDYVSPACPPIPLERASKAAAIKAVRAAGYRVMWRGGLHEKNVVTANDLRRSSGGGTADVMEAERRIGYALPDDAEIPAYLITVWPRRAS
jgi:hypothetical protein